MSAFFSIGESIKQQLSREAVSMLLPHLPLQQVPCSLPEMSWQCWEGSKPFAVGEEGFVQEGHLQNPT